MVDYGFVLQEESQLVSKGDRVQIHDRTLEMLALTTVPAGEYPLLLSILDDYDDEANGDYHIIVAYMPPPVEEGFQVETVGDVTIYKDDESFTIVAPFRW